MTASELTALRQELQLKLSRGITAAALTVEELLWLIEKVLDEATENERAAERDASFNCGMAEGLGDAIGAVKGAFLNELSTPAVSNLLRSLEEMKTDALDS